MNKQEQIIVSFTSFPTRIKKVHLVAQCMLRQTWHNLRVILWLSRDQFPNENIPLNLERLRQYGLEIRFVDEDLRSHKKYYYTFLEFPNTLCFLVDDDLFYPSTIIESSYKKYVEYGAKHVVVANYGFEMTYNFDGTLKKYTDWKRCDNSKFEMSEKTFFGSGGGTLMRPSDMYTDVCNMELSRKLTPLGDDIWLNAMTRLGCNKIVVMSDYNHMSIPIRKDVKLWDLNKLDNNGNDNQIMAIQNYYKDKLSKNIF